MKDKPLMRSNGCPTKVPTTPDAIAANTIFTRVISIVTSELIQRRNNVVLRVVCYVLR